MTVSHPAPRTAEQRRRDVLEHLEEDADAWVSTVNPDATPCLVPLSFLWSEGSLVMSTRDSRPTVRNLRAVPRARVALGHTRDVVLIDTRAGILGPGELPGREADAFAAKLGWDPREKPGWLYLRLRPERLLAWREENELADRELMRDGLWLAR
ncbi:pyridoxamine 5'-phosphate oxidase family protein [Streptomyces radiopugnans]|uniref:pyridoxamine 5'-phosphate oxidase family protein n=1 Tax=Streptomyces radiopugnans TaxID=403935 RepID=UPI003F1C505E